VVDITSNIGGEGGGYMLHTEARSVSGESSSSQREEQSSRRFAPNGGRTLNKGELRGSRRIPIFCQVKIRVPDSGEIAYGTTRNLSVDGLSLVTDYVPRFGEMLEVHVLPPAGGPTPPLHALVQVKRCIRHKDAQLFEIGVVIRRILK
jgi:hypothetical protein